MNYSEELEKRNEELQEKVEVLEEEYEKLAGLIYNNIISVDRDLKAYNRVFKVHFCFNEELYEYFLDCIHKNNRFL